MPRGSSGAVAGRTNRRGRRGGRRLRRLAPVTAGGRCRSGGGMGASWGRELKMTGVGPGAWWWSIWPLASPPGGEPDMDGSRASRRGKNGRAVEGLGGDEGRRGWPFSFYY
jgi:hypothetical protein